MTAPQIERARLLAQLTYSPIPVESGYAETFLFPDITIAEWCMDYDIKVETVTRGSGRRSDGKSNEYKFYQFSLIPDEEW